MRKTAENKPLARAWTNIKKYTHDPIVLSSLLGLTGYGLGRFAWGPMVETFRSLGRPFGKRLLGGNGQGGQEDAMANAQWNEAMDNLKEDAEKKRIVPIIGGVLTSAAALAALANPAKQHYGLLDFNAPLVPVAKKAAFEMNPDQSYIDGIDWDNRVQLGTARSLFADDPFLATRPGARLSGIAIVNDAAIREKTRTPTLGGIFDSAVDKIGKKLSLGGVVDVGIRTAVANGASRLLTGAIGAMCDLSSNAREKLIDAGTWAGAVTAILN